MAKKTSQRKIARSISVNSNVRCQRITPVEDTKRTIENLKTVGINLNKEQAIHLARVLLAVSQDWDVIDITAWRLEKRRKKDGTYRVTVTKGRQ